MFLRLSLKSLWSRKGSVALTLLAICISVFVMLGIEHIRQQAKSSFSKTVSGVDLIVGAPSGEINLLLYSVFRMGNPSNNISWSSFQKIQNTKAVAWAVPISLGDSHRGYRVIGTSDGYFHYFSYGDKQPLVFDSGQVFEAVFDVVLGAEVARKLGYSVGDKLVLSHGIGAASITKHDDNPFTVSGVLQPTGTPVDQSLHVSLQGLEAIHIGWQNGMPSLVKNPEITDYEKLQPKSITAIYVGLKSRLSTFSLQRNINQNKQEPLQAILPGVALSQLWQMLAMMENTLRLISVAVFIAALLGMAAMLLVSLKERQREIAILRALGASPLYVFCLIELEALLITLFAVVLACAGLWSMLTLLQSTLAAEFGLYVSNAIFSSEVLVMLALVMAGSLLIAMVPALSAYSKMLHSQLH